MRDRFRNLFKQIGSNTTIGIFNRFNDSIFQEIIEVSESYYFDCDPEM